MRLYVAGCNNDVADALVVHHETFLAGVGTGVLARSFTSRAPSQSGKTPVDSTVVPLVPSRFD